MKKVAAFLAFGIPLFTLKDKQPVTICDGDSALIYGNWQMNAGTYTNSTGNTTTLVVNPLPVITPNFISKWKCNYTTRKCFSTNSSTNWKSIWICLE